MNEVIDIYKKYLDEFESYLGFAICIWFKSSKYYSRILGVKRMSYNSFWIYLTDMPSFVCVSIDTNEYNCYAITLKTLDNQLGFKTDKIYPNRLKKYIIIKEF